MSDVLQTDACVAFTLARAKALFQDRLRAVFSIGSLAHGGFAPSVSDVDLAIILDSSISTEDQMRIDEINTEVKATGLPFCERVSIFWSDEHQLAKGEVSIGRFPAVDRLDFMDDRVLLFGTDLTQKLKVPSKHELILEAAEFALVKLLTPEQLPLILHSEKLILKGQRPVTKMILFPVRFIYTAATGKIGTNEAAVDYWLAHYPDDERAKLVRAAFEWRKNFSPEEASRLIPHQLALIYLEFIGQYVRWCTELGASDLASRFVCPRGYIHRVLSLTQD